MQRVVCGGCLDFKVVTALDAESFGAWEESKFAPEEKFLEKIKAIDGVTQVDRTISEIREQSCTCGALECASLSHVYAGGNADLHPHAHVRRAAFVTPRTSAL